MNIGVADTVASAKDFIDAWKRAETFDTQRGFIACCLHNHIIEYLVLQAFNCLFPRFCFIGKSTIRLVGFAQMHDDSSMAFFMHLIN